MCLPQSFSTFFFFLRESLTEANAHQLLSTELDLNATVPGFSHAFRVLTSGSLACTQALYQLNHLPNLMSYMYANLIMDNKILHSYETDKVDQRGYGPVRVFVGGGGVESKCR